MSATLPQPADRTTELEAEVARLYGLVCDQGDALARLTRENGAIQKFLRLHGATEPSREPSPGASCTDPAVAKIQARRRRIEASALRPA